MGKYCVLSLLGLFSFSVVNATELSALMNYCIFSTSGNKPFIETYLSVAGNTAVYKKNNSGKFQASIEIGILFSQKGAIKAFKKYVLISPELNDTITVPNFLDQQRFALDNGDYDMELTLQDKNKSLSKIISKKESVKINLPEATVNISGIELVESFSKAATVGPLTKNGYDLVPYIASFYPPTVNKLSFYSEIYNTNKVLGENEKYILMYFVETVQDAIKLNEFGGFSRVTAQPVSVLFTEIPIEKLESGNYNLVIEVHDKTNKIVAFTKKYFQRINPPKKLLPGETIAIREDIQNTFVAQYKNLDSLVEFIRSLRPICGDVENNNAENAIKTKDVKTLQRYLLSYWSVTEPKNPEGAWNNYHEQVMAVQKSFGTLIMKGYMTDRGRVYLKYGQPSVRQVMDKEPNAYPYEIWTFYRLGDTQSNRKFVFYDPDLAGNNYRLIHSDAIGEIYDTSWEMKIRKRDTQSTNLDMEKGTDHFGGNATEEFNHPK